MSQEAALEHVAENRYFISSLPDVFTKEKMKEYEAISTLPDISKPLELKPRIVMDRGGMLNYFFNVFTEANVYKDVPLEEMEIEVE